MHIFFVTFIACFLAISCTDEKKTIPSDYRELFKQAAVETVSIRVEKNRPSSFALVAKGLTGPGLAVKIVDPPKKGSVSVVDTRGVRLAASEDTRFELVYVANADSTGTDQFGYQFSDGTLVSNVGLVDIQIIQDNKAPVAQGATLSVEQNTTLNGSLSASDPDGDALSFTIESEPTNGQVTLDLGGSFTYRPNADYIGADQFVFRASDGLAASPAATITISIVAARIKLLHVHATDWKDRHVGLGGINACDTVLQTKPQEIEKMKAVDEELFRKFGMLPGVTVLDQSTLILGPLGPDPSKPKWNQQGIEACAEIGARRSQLSKPAWVLIDQENEMMYNATVVNGVRKTNVDSEQLHRFWYADRNRSVVQANCINRPEGGNATYDRQRWLLQGSPPDFNWTVFANNVNAPGSEYGLAVRHPRDTRVWLHYRIRSLSLSDQGPIATVDLEDSAWLRNPIMALFNMPSSQPCEVAPYRIETELEQAQRLEYGTLLDHRADSTSLFSAYAYTDNGSIVDAGIVSRANRGNIIQWTQGRASPERPLRIGFWHAPNHRVDYEKLNGTVISKSGGYAGQLDAVSVPTYYRENAIDGCPVGTSRVWNQSGSAGANHSCLASASSQAGAFTCPADQAFVVSCASSVPEGCGSCLNGYSSCSSHTSPWVAPVGSNVWCNLGPPTADKFWTKFVDRTLERSEKTVSASSSQVPSKPRACWVNGTATYAPFQFLTLQETDRMIEFLSDPSGPIKCTVFYWWLPGFTYGINLGSVDGGSDGRGPSAAGFFQSARDCIPGRCSHAP